MAKKTQSKVVETNDNEDDYLVRMLVDAVDGNYHLGRIPNTSISLEEQFDKRKGSIELNYARKINKGKYDKTLAKKGVKNLLVVPIARQIQILCKKHDSQFDNIKGCGISENVRDKATEQILEEIESNANDIVKEQPERLKIQRSRSSN